MIYRSVVGENFIRLVVECRKCGKRLNDYDFKTLNYCPRCGRRLVRIPKTVESVKVAEALNAPRSEKDACDGLRGLVKRLADRLEFERDLLPYDEDASALLAEAKAAVGEEARDGGR